jgi:hypothetical protein
MGDQPVETEKPKAGEVHTRPVETTGLESERFSAYSPGVLQPAEKRDSTHLPKVDIDFPVFQFKPALDSQAVVSDKRDEIKLRSEVDPLLSQDGRKLVALAEKTIDNPGYPNSKRELEQFVRDVETFERTAKANGLPDAEVQKVYKDIGRLLESAEPGTGKGQAILKSGEGIASDRQRIRVAEQLMNMVARPEDRSQGSYETCAMATVEGLLLTGKTAEPSKVTGMVADVALTGKTNAGGLEVKLDRQSMRSFGEHADNRGYGEDKQRLAENIFRLSAANTYYAIMKSEGKAEGQLQYVSRSDGNRLVYRRDETLPDKPALADLNKPEFRNSSPGEASTMVGESRILKQITGKDYKDRILVNTNVEEEDKKWVTGYSNLQELDDLVTKAKETGQLPLAVGVYTGNAIFQNGNTFDVLDGKSDKQTISELFSRMFMDTHSLLIQDRRNDFGFPQYQLKNTWGMENNISPSSKDFYAATEPVKSSEMAQRLADWSNNQVKQDKTYYERLTGAIVAVGLYGERQRDQAQDDGAKTAALTDAAQADKSLALLYRTVPQDTRDSIRKLLSSPSKDSEEQAVKDKISGLLLRLGY